MMLIYKFISNPKEKYCFYVQMNNEYAIEIGDKPRFIACWRRFKKCKYF